MAASDSKPWPDGYYYNQDSPGFMHKLEGNILINYPFTVIVMGLPGMKQGIATSTLTNGEFDEASEELVEASGIKNYNTKMEVFGSTKHAIWNAERQTFYQTSSAVNHGKVQALKWMSDEDAKKLIEECDPFENLPCPYYEPNPENQGKFIWVTGPPGAGKSTTCHMFSKTRKDFVYYEADTFLFLLNPFIDPAASSPTDGIMKNKAMKNVPTEVADALDSLGPIFLEFMVGNFANANGLEPLYRCIAKDIKERKAKMGLNWAVAQGCPTRYLRDAIKEENPEVIFIMLRVSPELQVKRIKERSGGKDAPQAMVDMMAKIFEAFPPADEDEKQAFNLEITEGMTPEDVGKKILELIKDC